MPLLLLLIVFFINSVNELGEKFERREINMFPIDVVGKSFNLTKTIEMQVNKVNSLVIKDIHQLDTMFVKTQKDIQTPVFTHLINLILI